MIPRSLLLWCIVVLTVSAQPDQWPAALLPYGTEGGTDSGKTSVVTRNKSEEGTFSSDNTIRLGINDSIRYLSQGAKMGYAWDPIRLSQEYTADLGGELALKKLFRFVDYAGLEWKPAMVVLRQSGYGNAQGKIEIGPMAGFSPLAIPVRAGAGVVATFWKDSLPGNVVDTRGVNREAGVYGVLDLPRISRSLEVVDLDFWADVTGRSMPHSRALTAQGGGLTKFEFGRDDTAMLFIADTFANGNDAFITNAVDRQLFVDKPTVRRNVFQIMPALRGSSRMGLVPGVAYSFAVGDERYPETAVDIQAHRETRSDLLFSLDGDSSLAVAYRGGIAFAWGDLDWMPGRSFMLILPDSSKQDAYNRNTGDYRRFAVATRHTLGRELPFWGAVVNAGFDLKRESQTYSRFYLKPDAKTGFDTIRNNGDNDRVTMRLSLDYRVFSVKLMDLNLRGEYARNLTSFIRSSRSGSNSVDSMVLLGGSAVVRPWEPVTVTYAARAQVDMSRFIYPWLHTRPEERPPYSRVFKSDLTLVWNIFPAVDATVQWVEGYADYGNWYGAQYQLPDSASRDSGHTATDYYAILNIVQDHTLRLSFKYSIKQIGSVTVGGEYTDLYYRQWYQTIGRFDVGESDADYRVEPFVEARIVAGPAVMLAARFKPVLVAKVLDPRSLLIQYWNFAVQGRFLF